mmetsp:Transcript_23002/g.26377  ORF Transcript_23002/g.26377 Transcript_23002/m.26377 type:complete len:117 (+) Transcript_23002:190-540(+)
MVYSGEFNLGQKSGLGRLECYPNAPLFMKNGTSDLSMNSLIPQYSEVTHKNYKAYIRDSIMAEVKKDVEGDLAKIVSRITQQYKGVELGFVKDKIREFDLDEYDMEDLRKEKTKSV